MQTRRKQEHHRPPVPVLVAGAGTRAGTGTGTGTYFGTGIDTGTGLQPGPTNPSPCWFGL